VANPSTKVAQYLERGADCLRLADGSVRDDLKAEYRRMAEHYAALAEGEQKIDASLKRLSAAERAAKRSVTGGAGWRRRRRRLG
jgi:hypothetical protein